MMMKLELKLPSTLKSLKFIFVEMSIILQMLNILTANVSRLTVTKGENTIPSMYMQLVWNVEMRFCFTGQERSICTGACL